MSWVKFTKSWLANWSWMATLAFSLMMAGVVFVDQVWADEIIDCSQFEWPAQCGDSSCDCGWCMMPEQDNSPDCRVDDWCPGSSNWLYYPTSETGGEIQAAVYGPSGIICFGSQGQSTRGITPTEVCPGAIVGVSLEDVWDLDACRPDESQPIVSCSPDHVTAEFGCTGSLAAHGEDAYNCAGSCEATEVGGGSAYVTLRDDACFGGDPDAEHTASFNVTVKAAVKDMDAADTIADGVTWATVEFKCPPPQDLTPQQIKNIFSLPESNEEGSRVVKAVVIPGTNRRSYKATIKAGHNAGDGSVEVEATDPTSGKKISQTIEISCIPPLPDGGGGGGEKQEGKQGCCGGKGDNPGQGAAGLGSVDFTVNLGSLPGGGDPGRIYLSNDGDYDLGKRFSLHYQGDHPDVEQIHDGAGLRQVKTPGLLVDVVSLLVNNIPYVDDSLEATGDLYEIRFYHSSDVAGLGTDSLYELNENALPYVVWSVNNPGAINIHEEDGPTWTDLDIQKFELVGTNGYAPRIRYEYDLVPADFATSNYDDVWTLRTKDGNGTLLLDEELTVTHDPTSPGERTETYVRYDGEVAVKTVVDTYDESWYGLSNVDVPLTSRSISLGQSQSPLVWTWKYYNELDSIRDGLIAISTEPYGEWVANRYNETIEGMLSDATIRGLGNEAAPTSTATIPAYNASGVSSTVTSYYTEADTTVDERLLGYNKRVLEFVAGVKVSEVNYSYSLSGSELTTTETRVQGTDTLVTVTTVDLDHDRRLVSVVNADHTMTTYAYDDGTFNESVTAPEFTVVAGGAYQRVRVSHGYSNSGSFTSLPYKSLREVAVRDTSGNTVLEETHVASTNQRIAWTVREYDDRGHEIATYSSKGTKRTVDWDETACCGTRTVTDEQGVVTDVVYDSFGLLTSQTRYGVDGATAPLDADVVTTFERSYVNGLRVVETEVASTVSGLQPLTSYQRYDALDRLVEETDAAGLTTSYSYSISASTGGKLVAKTLPGGTTEITEHYCDGRVKSISGTATIPQAYLYGVNGDGTQWTEILEGTSDPTASSWPRWRRTTTDMFGHTVSEERPGYSSGTLTTTYNFDELGRLESVCRPGQAGTLYVYDELGRQTASGLDVDGSGTLVAASSDRMTESEYFYSQDATQTDIWEWTMSTAYVTDNSAADKVVSTQRSRLTGFTYNDSGANVTGEQVTVVDYYRSGTIAATETSSHSVSTNRSAHEVTRTSSAAGASNTAVSVSVNGLTQSSTSPSGVTTLYGYDGLGRQISVTDGRGNTTTTYYSDNGRVDHVINGNGDETRYGYDSTTGRLASVGQERDDGGFNYTYYGHNNRGQVEKVWGDVPQPTWTEYDAYGQREYLHTYRDDADFTAAVWPTGDVTQWVYDEETGVLLEKVDAAGESVAYTYYNDGKLYERIWARTDVGEVDLKTTYSYDSNTGAMSSVDYSDTVDSPDVSFTYRRTGELSGVANADLLATDHSFDFSQWPEQITETISGLYSASIVRSYDATAGRRPVGVVVGSEYDLDYYYNASTGELNRVTGPGLPGYGAEYSYMTGTGGRESNLVTGIAFKSDASTVAAEVETVYESGRNVLDYIENRWVGGGTPAVVSKYDATNDVLGRRTSTAYSGSAFSASLSQSYEHNARNELTGSVRSDSGSWDYDYDNIGNRLSSSDSQGQTEYVSNGLNQYLRRGVGGGLRYDADGNLTNIGSAADLDDDGDVDVDDFVIFQPQLTGPLAEVAAAAMAMEQMAAPMALMAAPQAEAVVVELWTDEESSATLRVKGLSGGPALTVLQPHTTYQLHYRAGVEEVNGFMVSVYADGDAQEISGVTASTGEWSDADVFEFIDMATAGGDPTYDGNGCMLRQIVHGFWFTGSGESVEELADRRGQLFQFTTGDAGTIHFELFMDWIDVASREGVWMRTDLTVEVVDPTASASSASDVIVVDGGSTPHMGFDAQFGSALVAALLATGGTEPEFALADLDGDGDADLADFAMFQAAFGTTGGTRYTWNTENRLTGVERLAPSAGDVKVQFAYDHMGRRVLKRVWTYTAGSWGNPTAETKYVYDGWRVIMELDGLNSDAVTRKFTWGLDLSGSVEGAGGIGGLLAAEDTAGTTVATDDRSFIYFYELNGNVGQSVETTTGTDYGTIAAKYEYDPYGKRINTASPGEYDQPYRFSTKPVDDETGLGCWGYRYYSYDLGRWVSRDPIGERGGNNLYGYVGNGSVLRVDGLGQHSRLVDYDPWSPIEFDPPAPAEYPFVIGNYLGGVGHYLAGGGTEARLSDHLIAELKEMDFYVTLLTETLPQLARSLVPKKCCQKETRDFKIGGKSKIGTAPIEKVAGYNGAPGQWGIEPQYDFNLNTTIGTIDRLRWKVTCTVGSSAPTGGCCEAYARGCRAQFVLDDQYTFRTGFKDFVFELALGDILGGEPYPVHNEWEEDVPSQLRTICN